MCFKHLTNVVGLSIALNLVKAKLKSLLLLFLFMEVICQPTVTNQHSMPMAISCSQQSYMSGLQRGELLIVAPHPTHPPALPQVHFTHKKHNLQGVILWSVASTVFFNIVHLKHLLSPAHQWRSQGFGWTGPASLICWFHVWFLLWSGSQQI